MVRGLLVIVPCGQKKIWGRNPKAGATQAKDAYTGPPFRLNREYAEHFGEEWIVLSAKYGFIRPNLLIGPYNVTFKDDSTGPVATAKLREQVHELELSRFSMIVGLGGKEYLHRIKAAFEEKSVQLRFPFEGRNMIKLMQATRQAIDADDPFGKAAAARNGKKSKRKDA